MFQELDAVLHHGVPQHDHVLGHVLQQRQEASLNVEPCVCPELKVMQHGENASAATFTISDDHNHNVLTVDAF